MKRNNRLNCDSSRSRRCAMKYYDGKEPIYARFDAAEIRVEESSLIKQGTSQYALTNSKNLLA